MQKIGILSVLAAGILWGCTGIFVRVLQGDYGFTSYQIVTMRLTVAAIAFVILAAARGIECLKVKIRHLPILFCTGFFGVMMLAVTYFLSMTYSSLSVAAILMYTAPVFVMLASLVLFGEKLNRQKIVALILATVGLIFVSGIMQGDANVTAIGVVMGLLSGITYASYSIFGTYALRNYESFTVTSWAFVFAGAGSLFIGDLPDISAKFVEYSFEPKLVFLVVGMGIFSAFMPFLLYTAGLSRLEASKAIILASVEPLVATLLGIFLFREPTDLFSILGIILILAAVIMVSLKKE